jgi:hypothetical protein
MKYVNKNKVRQQQLLLAEPNKNPEAPSEIVKRRTHLCSYYAPCTKDMQKGMTTM